MAEGGALRPTLHDIARETGLSIATVSRALHRDRSPNVSDDTRRRVREVARNLGYSPNLAGRSLATGRSHTVSYWTFDAFAPYYAMVARLVCDQAQRRGYYVIINNTTDPARSLHAEGAGTRTGNPLASGTDGVIACDVAFEANEYAALLRSRSIPFVGIGLNYPRDRDFVGVDLYEGGVIATRHLIAQGARRVAHMTQSRGTGVDPRSRGYHYQMREAGRQPELISVLAHHRAPARQAIVEYVRSRRAAGKPIPDAIFCVNDEVAIGCYRGLCDLGLRVPEDVMLVGCDGIEDAEYHACPISTLVLPVERMSSLAWDFLESRLRDREQELQQTTLLPELVVRESSRRDAKS